MNDQNQVNNQSAKKYSHYQNQDLGDAFNHFSDLNAKGLFLLRHQTIPNFHEISHLDIKEAFQWFTNHYQASVHNQHITKRNYTENKSLLEVDDIIVEFSKDTIIHFDHNQKKITICYDQTDSELIEEVSIGFMKFIKNEMTNQIGLFATGHAGLYVQQIDLNFQEIDLSLNYNDDFIPVHDVILKRLCTEKDKGIVLLHGTPGTGKTTYIRHLISKVKKQVIFLSAQITESLNTPHFMSLLLENTNSILVIEDAERILVHRDYDKNSPVATLLNLADGLLSDCLNIQLICSFNTDISKIDPALTRKGRLIAKYEFTALEIPKANELAKALGKNTTYHKPTNLTEIYNEDELTFRETESQSAIGFGNLN